MIDFKNKNILITGASGGIGNALVKKFVSLGGNVLGTGTKSEKLDLIKKKYPSIKVKRFDMSEHSKIEEFIDNATLELGGLDILVNNAGTNLDNLSLRMKDEEWKKVIDINLTATFLLSKHAIKTMLKNKFGRIVNITSVVGHTGNLGQSNYAASKAGVEGMSKSLALEVASRNITVNCVAPGFIDTDMTKDLLTKNGDIIKKNIPMGRVGLTNEVANLVSFLASDQAGYITGQTIHINGGLYV